MLPFSKLLVIHVNLPQDPAIVRASKGQPTTSEYIALSTLIKARGMHGYNVLFLLDICEKEKGCSLPLA
jgi:hypothetical protein